MVSHQIESWPLLRFQCSCLVCNESHMSCLLFVLLLPWYMPLGERGLTVGRVVLAPWVVASETLWSLLIFSCPSFIRLLASVLFFMSVASNCSPPLLGLRTVPVCNHEGGGDGGGAVIFMFTMHVFLCGKHKHNSALVYTFFSFNNNIMMLGGRINSTKINPTARVTLRPPYLFSLA